MKRISYEDSFLDAPLFAQLKKEVRKKDFMSYSVGDKLFDAMAIPTSLLNPIYTKIESQGYKCVNMLSFIRSDHYASGNKWNIHADTQVLGQKPSHAAVLYISEPNADYPLTGTAFWEHRLYGAYLPSHISDEKYNEMVEVCANNKTEWELRSVIGHKANRILIYPANAFHSKYPNIAWGQSVKEGRIVLTMFFKMMEG